MVSIKEGLILLADTEQRVTYQQLAHQLKGARRTRSGKVDYYGISDVLVAHRAIVDRHLS